MEGDDVVQVPLGALFRTGADWTVFRIVDGKAVATRVVLGHRNNQAAEIVEGLEPGDRVVLHPSDRVADGVAVEDAPKARVDQNQGDAGRQLPTLATSAVRL